jgi:DNA excision repair protein ERCC-2
LDNLENPAFFPCLSATESKRNKSVELELKCLDPRPITDAIFKETYATLSLSGTIHPYTFTTLLGLNDTGKMLKIIKMKPPFPKENIRALFIQELNTKGDNRTDLLYSDMMPLLKEIIQNTPKNVGVFCASYDVLEGLWRNGFEDMVKALQKKCYREEPGMNAGDNDILIEKYKEASKNEGAVLLGVSGGRNSEGEDFPGDYMNSVVIVGIPFQRPNPSLNAKIAYYDKLFNNNGRIFAYTAPAMQKANQGCGRPVRRMTDRAVIVLLDSRFIMYKDYVSDWIKENMAIIPPDVNILRNELKKFCF